VGHCDTHTLSLSWVSSGLHHVTLCMDTPTSFCTRVSLPFEKDTVGLFLHTHLSILLQLFNPFIACYARALLVPAVLWFCETPLATPRHATPRHVPGPDRCHVAELISSPRVRFHRVPPNQTTDRPVSAFVPNHPAWPTRGRSSLFSTCEYSTRASSPRRNSVTIDHLAHSRSIEFLRASGEDGTVKEDDKESLEVAGE
jgi:hypothetical protein